MAAAQATSRRTRRYKTDLSEIILYIFLGLLCVITILPFMQVITISLSPGSDINSHGFHIIPKHFYLEGYKKLLHHALIWSGYKNTILRVVLGTLLSVAITVLAAYPLSKRDLPHRTFWTAIIVFTMYFSGGMIPRYLVVQGLGLRDTLFSLILPNAIKAYNLIITRNFFMSIPPSMEESARIDGANDVTVLVRIIIPVSTAIIATITLWYGVALWNEWFDCMLFIDHENQYVLQMVVRRLLTESQSADLESAASGVRVNPDNIKMAAVIVSSLPILCAYPFLQKYFVKGVMVGSLKG